MTMCCAEQANPPLARRALHTLRKRRTGRTAASCRRRRCARLRNEPSCGLGRARETAIV